MEHLITTKDVKPIDVPFVCTEDFDGGDFMAYPERQGWAWDELMGYQNFGNRPPEKVEAFFQTWLFFGALINIFKLFDIEAKTSDFIRETEQGEKFITTKLLPVLIQEWISREGVYGGDSKNDNPLLSAHKISLLDQSQSKRLWRRDMVHMILTRVSLFVDKFCSTKAQEDAKTFGIEFDPWPMSPKVAMSIMALGPPFSRVLWILYHVDFPNWGSSPFLNDRLREAGWCVRDIPFHLPGTSVIDCDYYFISYLSPRRDLDHSQCTTAICCAKNVVVETYETKHVVNDCYCEHIPVPEGDILEIVERNGIPVVSWRDGKLSVTKYDNKSTTKYIAISHVWSDGLGNERKNSLPPCQLTRLQNMIDQIYIEDHNSVEDADEGGDTSTHVGFWMDTLCVPVGNDYRDYRKAAIRKMGDIYRSADRVLILDSLIFEVSHSADIIEKYTRLYLSNWHRRLWTLQEGLFAQKLFVQFSDKALKLLDMDTEAQNYMAQSIPQFYSSVVSSFSSEISMLYMYWFMLEPTDSQNFEMFADKVCSRMTTKQEDESICFSTIMGKDPGPLFEAEDGKRMECFYQMVGTFKPQIIFNDFPRLPTEGFGWAPRSFVGQSYKLFPTLFKHLDTPDTTLHPDGGLRVTFPGVKLGAVGPYLGTKIFVVPRDEPWFWYEVRLRPDHEGRYPTWDSKSKYMIVLEEPLSDRGPGIEAILGIVNGTEKNERIRIRHVCRARVEIPDQEDLEDLKELSDPYLEGKTQFTSGEKGFDGTYPVYGDILGEDQMWCVS